MLTAFGCSSPQEQDQISIDRINIMQALSSTAEGECYDKADAPRPIGFPKDAGSHDGFRTEWWYYTGNLKNNQGRHFGYQLTFFRQALSCEPVKGASKWRTRQLYFAHFAVTDTRSGTFYSNLRMNRQSLGIAGSQQNPYTVWVDDWRVRQVNDRLVLTARGDEILLELVLTQEKPVILQGNQGLSRKGRKPFNASFYYSLPRLKTSGTLQVGPDIHKVDGNTWFDHEWSTSALDADVSGWDWFSAHLDDGRDFMVCQIRKPDGTPNNYGFGSLCFPDGTYEILNKDDFTIQTKGYWTSPATGRRYPGAWEITLPGHGIKMAVTPVIPNQEHIHMFPYWEGAARFSGKEINGFGYVELTGY